MMFIIYVPENTHSQYIKNLFINKKENSSVEKRGKIYSGTKENFQEAHKPFNSCSASVISKINFKIIMRYQYTNIRMLKWKRPVIQSVEEDMEQLHR